MLRASTILRPLSVFAAEEEGLSDESALAKGAANNGAGRARHSGAPMPRRYPTTLALL